MIIGIPKEIKDREYRIAMTPGGVQALVAAGNRVLVQAGAGAGSGFADADYARNGAEISGSAAEVWSAGLVVKVKEPQPVEFDFLRPDLILFAFLHLAAEELLTRELARRGLTAIGYETVETDDGKLPLLKPMSEIAGRISVQIGAHYLEKKNGGKGKLLGGVPGVPPARVTIVGGGIVGRNAAKIALGMGGDVTILDRDHDRLRHLEEILPGRLRTLSSDPSRLAEAAAEADLLIGAVLVKGARAPRVITRAMISAMQAGSVAVDVSVDQGGCMET
ncbi:MAG TPA: alanine dehydrogenase, partial [Syntrophales bacterium]|nr:alanine dehydrogenase [Syntrophales bacterium]